MRENGDQTYLFGPFRLEPGEQRLVRDGRSVSLTPKAFDTLVLLVKRAGHLVEKEELMSALWPDSFVEEANVSQYVWTLRKILGEGENGGVFIETVARKGFRFVAPVTVQSKTDGDLVSERVTSSRLSMKSLEFPAKAATSIQKSPLTHESWLSRHLLRAGIVALVLTIGLLGLTLLGLSKRRAAATRTGSQVKTLAVLPFKPLSADSRDESLEMGMAETLITRLSNVKQIVVRPMSAVRKYTDPQQDLVKAGQELQAEAVLDGSIQKSGDRVRVTVRLLDIRNGATLWAENFDENLTDIFQVQDSISARVTSALLVRLSGNEQNQLYKRNTTNLEAYQLYLQGEHLRDKRDYIKALELYQHAIEKDPNFALAHVGLAESYMHLTSGDLPRIPAQQAAPRIRAALGKALELDESLAEAHNLLAEVKYQREYDWSGAEKEFLRALELNPSVAEIRLSYGWYLMTAGRFQEALPQMQKAQELDSRNLLIQLSLGVLGYFSRDYDKALDRFQKILEVEPNYPGAFYWIELIYNQKGMYAEGLEYGMKDGVRSGRLKPEDLPKRREILRESGWPGILRLRLEIFKERAKTVSVSPKKFAEIYAQLGDKDQAFSWLEKGIAERDPFIVQLKIEPQYDSLRSDPRYTKLLQRLNLHPD